MNLAIIFLAKEPERQNRNRNSEYLAQRRKGRQEKHHSELSLLGIFA